jgi:hypothetical protein
MHIIVIDVNGTFTGTTGAVLEVFPFVSKGVDAKDNDGGASYYKTVIYNQSAYIHWMGKLPAVDIGLSVVGKAFGNLVADIAAQTPVSQPYTKTLAHGTDAFDTIADGDIQTAWSLFASPENVDIAFAFAGPASVANSSPIDNNPKLTNDPHIIHINYHLCFLCEFVLIHVARFHST